MVQLAFLGPVLIQPSELIKPFFGATEHLWSVNRIRWSVRTSWLLIFACAFKNSTSNLSTTALCGMTRLVVALAGGLVTIST